MRGGAAVPPAGSLSSTNSTWVSVSPMFSPACCCAGSQRAPPGSSTSRCSSPAMQPPTERAQRVHDAVGVLVRRRAVAGPVGVLEHPHPVVLEDHRVVVRVGLHRVEAHAAILVGLSSNQGRIHICPSHSANRSLVQPRSFTSRCHSMPSVIAQMTSRHSSSVTASWPVSPPPAPSPSSRRAVAGPSLQHRGRRRVARRGADCTISWNGAMRRAVCVENAACSTSRLRGRAPLRIATTSGRSWKTMSCSSPPTVMSHASVQQRRLVAERGVDRLDRHARGAGDVGDRRAAVALLDEQLARGPHDRATGLRRLRPAAGRVVRTGFLTGSPDFDYTLTVFITVTVADVRE